MAVRMRLTRVGSKKNPIYRVVVADSRSPRDGKFIEIVGRYNPQTDPSLIEFDEAKVKDWLSKGVQPSDAVSRLLKVKKYRLMTPTAELVEYLARRLSRSRTRCASKRTTRTATLVIRLHVRAEDIGRVIGRGGRIARALRTVVRACGAREDRRVLHEIDD